MSRPLLTKHLPTLSWAALVGWLLLIPAEGPSSGSGLGGWIVGWSSTWADILAHFLAFGILARLSARSLGALGSDRPLLIAVLMASSYGVVLEVAQSLVPGRGTQLLDIAVNVLGAATLGRLGWRP